MHFTSQFMREKCNETQFTPVRIALASPFFLFRIFQVNEIIARKIKGLSLQLIV